jgi:hypothetical protein
MTTVHIPTTETDYRRFLDECEHVSRPFGPGSFGQRAEAFARFFGTPKFLIGQTSGCGLLDHDKRNRDCPLRLVPVHPP